MTPTETRPRSLWLLAVVAAVVATAGAYYAGYSRSIDRSPIVGPPLGLIDDDAGDQAARAEARLRMEELELHQCEVEVARLRAEGESGR